jgi:glycosyltransferase involved in cell wall biosynthesis
VESILLSFAERGLAQAFMEEVKRHDFDGRLLTRNTPRFFACVREVAETVRQLKADLLCASGYKPDLVGWRAARRIGVPIISVSHGWTAATWRVRVYEALDRCVLRRMDAVVCVSNAQADKVRRAGVPEAKIAVIHNAVGAEAFTEPCADARQEMSSWFKTPPRWIIGAAGRLSPEKGFEVLIDAAQRVNAERPGAGFVIFGDGPMREELQQLIAARGLQSNFVLAGFRKDVQRFLPSFDIGVMSSHTEGLPIILLETCAAGVPSVATAVGGIPEVIEDGRTGYLAPAGDAMQLAARIVNLLDDDSLRQSMGRAARDRVRRDFSFAITSRKYLDVFNMICAGHASH